MADTSVDEQIDEWVRDLHSEDTEAAENAKHGLASLGPRVLDRVVAALPGLDHYGRLCAIEIFTEVGDPGPAAALIPLLADEDRTVRQWAAEALGELGVQGAVPAIQAAYAAFRRSGDPLDYSEGVGLRGALTALGAREQVLPPEAIALQATVASFEHAWPVEHLTRVVELLAQHGQAVLYFLLWQTLPDGGTHWYGGPQIDWPIDRSLPWERIVTDSRDWAQLAAAAVPQRADLFAIIEWIAAEDL